MYVGRLIPSHVTFYMYSFLNDYLGLTATATTTVVTVLLNDSSRNYNNKMMAPTFCIVFVYEDRG